MEDFMTILKITSFLTLMLGAFLIITPSLGHSAADEHGRDEENQPPPARPIER
jgi:hypothetical protein